MTTQEKIATVQSLVGNDEGATDALIRVYIKQAESVIFNQMFPFKDMPDDFTVPAKYEMYQCSLAQRYFLRRGAEGEMSHDENGISRSYGSVDDSDILQNIMQVAKVI